MILAFIPQIDSLEIGAVIIISIVTAILFDLPLQTICKMIVDSGTSEDIAAEAERQQQQIIIDKKESKLDTVIEETTTEQDLLTEESDVKSVWVEDEGDAVEDEAAEPPQYMQRSSSLRSYSPIWKKDDEEPPAWDLDDVGEHSENVQPIWGDDDKKQEHSEEEEEESEEDDEDEESEKSDESVRKL